MISLLNISKNRISSRALWKHARLWLSYLAAFVATFEIARIWGGSYFFSLWYPAAGVRLAFLWRYGERWTPAVMLAELLAQGVLWIAVAGHPLSPKAVVDIILPPLTTGCIIAAVRWEERRNQADLAIDNPLPFGLATILVPTGTALVRGGWQWLWARYDASATSLPTSAFLLGDLLGVLVVAPIFLWLTEDKAKPRNNVQNILWPPRRVMRQAVPVFMAGWLLAILLPDLRLMPVMLAMTWLGLSLGSKGAWIAIILSGGITLLWSALAPDVPTRLTLHVGLVIAAVSAYLAGSYTDAQRSARQAIARRNRLLFQAERLKTLRAMSVAVIHEISQPLSTLAIESRHLATVSQKDMEIAESAAIVARKVDTLSAMIRRLRQFGGRALDNPAPVSLVLLIGEVVKLAAGEAASKAGAVKLALPDEDIVVLGQEIELTQAFLNLVRNAMAASPAGPIIISLTRHEQDAKVTIINLPASAAPDSGGFGVGSLIARTIIATHGGGLTREESKDGWIVHETRLPAIGTPYE